MPTIFYNFLNQDIDYNDEEVILYENHCYLRPTNMYTGYYSTNTENLILPVSSIITFSNHKAHSLFEFFSFEYELTFKRLYSKLSNNYNQETDDDIGKVEFQISNDNGITWYNHNGTNWVVSTTLGTWNKGNIIQKYIPSFILKLDRQIKLRMKITSSTNRKISPIVKKIAIDVEYSFNFNEDIKRTIKHFLEENLQANRKFIIQLDSNATNLKIYYKKDTIENNSFRWDLQLKGIKNIYNLTDDEGRTTNLFDSFITVDGISTINLISSVAVGAKLEIEAFGLPKIFFKADSDYYLSEIPYIELDTNADEDDIIREHSIVVEKNIELKKSRVRNANIIQKVESKIIFVSSSMLDVMALSDAFFKLTKFPFEKNLKSEACGENIEIINIFKSEKPEDIEDELYAAAYDFDLIATDWQGSYKEVAISEEIIFGTELI